ncbi:MAG: MoxR-like protein ATPase in aerotolerance operon [candidate division TM6 bacterium GW2011_GWF2_38_10]|nr:MAG: MoxR-like protein ATPase in aerotolerance operon [candidate division TM6 bacterium GW2011_GWF2_38_10]
MENLSSSQLLADQVKDKHTEWQNLKNEVKKIIVGQDYIVDRLFIGLLCNSHVLLEGVPGLAKTMLVKTIAQALGLQFQRIQFTPDLLPADLIGTLVYSPKTQEFQTKKGPIFANLILADEINRAPAKVQSALLEAMQEHQVTIGDTTFALDEPFFVLATQNPIDQEGTYRLPEAQVDRFLFKLIISYPKMSEEKEIITKNFEPKEVLKIIDKQSILDAQKLVQNIYIDDKVIEYILSIVFATRNPKEHGLADIEQYIQYGASPRATLALTHAAKAHAFLRKRHFVIPDDIKAVAADILRHRVILTYEAEAENVIPEAIIQKILRIIPSP